MVLERLRRWPPPRSNSCQKFQALARRRPGRSSRPRVGRAKRRLRKRQSSKVDASRSTGARGSRGPAYSKRGRSLGTVRIYKVAELLGTTSQEVTALLKRDHGIDLKSASSTIEEVVARQFVERLARQRNISLPGGDIFADTPAVKGKKGGTPAKKAEPARPVAPPLPPPRLVKTVKPAVTVTLPSSEPETVREIEPEPEPAPEPEPILQARAGAGADRGQRCRRARAAAGARRHGNVARRRAACRNATSAGTERERAAGSPGRRGRAGVLHRPLESRLVAWCRQRSDCVSKSSDRRRRPLRCRP